MDVLPLSWLKKVDVIPDRRITESRKPELVETLLRFSVLLPQMNGQSVMKIYKRRFDAVVNLILILVRSLRGFEWEK